MSDRGRPQFAVNYSPQAADLLLAGRISFDRFKCPAWPDLLAAIPTVRPAYVHFPLTIGTGMGDAVDSETKRAPDWGRVEALLRQTQTPLVNLHLVPTIADHPDVPLDSTAPEHVDRLTECLIRDARSVVDRFGPDRVIVENVYDFDRTVLRPAYLPAVARAVVEATGCGLLFDLSHARLAAESLAMDAREYIAALPMGACREIHITGIQSIDGDFIDRVVAAGINLDEWQPFFGSSIDHLPLTDADWSWVTWVAGEVRRGAWGQPWIVALEYGGVGKFWEAFSDSSVLAEQVPRLRDLLQRR